MRIFHDHLYHTQHCGMMWIIESIQLGIMPVDFGGLAKSKEAEEWFTLLAQEAGQQI